MQRTTRLRVCLLTAAFAVGFISSPNLYAKTDEGIQHLLDSPASAFDVFLLRLYMDLNGSTYFEGPNEATGVNVFDLEYDVARDVVLMKIYLLPSHPLMEGFDRAGSDLKKNIVLTAAQDISKQVGIEKRDNGRRSGAIQRVRLRNGPALPRFDDDKVKDAIADRVELEVIVPGLHTKDQVRRSVLRTTDGRYQYDIHR
jgi:hypothetical protein